MRIRWLGSVRSMSSVAEFCETTKRNPIAQAFAGVLDTYVHTPEKLGRCADKVTAKELTTTVTSTARLMTLRFLDPDDRRRRWRRGPGRRRLCSAGACAL